MAAILASQICYYRNGGLVNQGKSVENLNFSGSISNYSYLKFRKKNCNFLKTTQVYRFQVHVQQIELPANVGRNGWIVEMVPTSVIRVKMLQCKDTSERVYPNEEKVTGVSLVKRDPSFSLSDEFSPIDCVKVDEGFSWANENYSSIHRTIDIWSFVISLQVRVLLDNAKWTYRGGFTEEKQEDRRRKTASWLRECILELGPTFIKIGQLLSARSDLFPSEFVNELANLQDKVPAFSPSKAKKLIEKQLGAPIKVLFKEFEDLPIAAASLGQVHRAILHNGDEVAVKVQRPGLKKLFDIDLRNLKLIVEYLQRNETLGGPFRGWNALYEDCAKILYKEINYVNEGKNADRFRRDFRNFKWVRIPLVYWDYTAMEVLTLEYIPGIKINRLDIIDARGYSRSKISACAVEAYIIQMLETGFFHADPHPGNLAIDVDGTIIFYDFGMMGDINSSTREMLLELFFAIYEMDASKVVQVLIDLGVLGPSRDLSSVKRSVQFFLDNLFSQRPDQQQTFAAIGEDLLAIAADLPFQYPSTFMFVLRAFSTLEGIGYMLDPDFSFAKIAEPYIQELFKARLTQQTGAHLIGELRKQADDARSSTLLMPYRVQRIEDFVKQLESGDIKLRVRVLESERAARRATILQAAIMHLVLGGTLINLYVTFIYASNQLMARASWLGAGVFFTLFMRSMQRVNGLDKLEKMI